MTLRSLRPALLLLAAAACSSDPEPESTFQVIQRRIFQPSCTQGCHTAGTAFATQSGLVLDKETAYGQLTGKSPKNTAAVADGLAMIDLAGGAQAPERSFLWQKIDTGHDHETEHAGYGQRMPLGREPLTNGELELIRQWIVAGAPESGVVAAETLLNDTTRTRTAATFVPLTPPASGVQYKLGPFDVAPGFEREFNYFRANTNPDTLYIKRVEISMRPGSHHFILYSFAPNTPANLLPQPEQFRDLRLPNGSLNFTVINQMAFHVFFSGTQWPRFDDTLPPGVALEWPAGQGLDWNAHYVNKTAATTQGEIHVNLHTVPKSQVVHKARVLNIGNQNLTLPAGQTTTVRYTSTATGPMRIIKMFTHAHQLMTRFEIQVVGGPRDGEIVYTTTDWEHPPILSLNPPLELQAGQGLRLIATYTNWRATTVRFGLTSEDEMMILFGYYY